MKARTVLWRCHVCKASRLPAQRDDRRRQHNAEVPHGEACPHCARTGVASRREARARLRSTPSPHALRPKARLRLLSTCPAGAKRRRKLSNFARPSAGCLSRRVPSAIARTFFATSSGCGAPLTWYCRMAAAAPQQLSGKTAKCPGVPVVANGSSSNRRIGDQSIRKSSRAWFLTRGRLCHPASNCLA